MPVAIVCSRRSPYILERIVLIQHEDDRAFGKLPEAVQRLMNEPSPLRKNFAPASIYGRHSSLKWLK